MIKRTISFLFLLSFLSTAAFSQIYQPKLGAWYMYFWNTTITKSGFGMQGDVQYRNWNLAGDLEQLLLRAGPTYTIPKTRVKMTLGYAYILSESFADTRSYTQEHRIYQEALIPQRLGEKFLLTHRFRLEQRDVDGQDRRNRARYFLAVNYPFNRNDLGEGAVYLSFYNELFINLEQSIGNGRYVDHFDRNRAYLALGYSVSDNVRLQFGYMHQDTDEVSKGQVQFNLFHRFSLN